jgi:hypothetical protein
MFTNLLIECKANVLHTCLTVIKGRYLQYISNNFENNYHRFKTKIRKSKSTSKNFAGKMPLLPLKT